MRRLLSVALLAVLVSTSAACAQNDDNSTNASGSGAAATTPTSSPSPTVDVKANTKQVCDKAEALLTADTVKPIGVQIGLMIQAKQAGNKTAETAAMNKAKELADALAKQVRDLKAEAADTKLQAALDKAADGLTMFGSPDYLSKINSIDDLTKLTNDITAAGQDLETACNA